MRFEHEQYRCDCGCEIVVAAPLWPWSDRSQPGQVVVSCQRCGAETTVLLSNAEEARAINAVPVYAIPFSAIPFGAGWTGLSASGSA